MPIKGLLALVSMLPFLTKLVISTTTEPVEANQGRALEHFDHGSNATSSTTELTALLAFKASIRTDPTGALANWAGENGSNRCRTWRGVICNSRRQVIKIQLSKMALHGNISHMIRDLKHLEELHLNSNHISGFIPAELGSLKKLESLDLYNNSLSGGIPKELGNLESLSKLDLSNNRLSGTIPKELGSLNLLTDLYLDNNILTGSVPTELGNLESLSILDLSNNTLNGSFPAATLGRCLNLSRLILATNNFMPGPIPDRFRSLKKLEVLDLRGNNLVGTVPTFLGALGNLRELYLTGNNLTGDIPAFSSPFLQILFLSGNRLNGSALTLSSLQRCSALTTINLENNQIHGPLQLNFSEFPNLQYVSVAGNNLTGTIPASIGQNLQPHLVILDFRRNGFSGEISTDVNGSNLPGLGFLLLSHNKLQGTIPSWIGTLPELQVLDFSHNSLTGAIPDSFAEFKRFKENPTRNTTESVAPVQDFKSNFYSTYDEHSYFGDATTIMDLSFNALNGSIPPGFEGLTALRYLYLSNNHIEGEIPVWNTSSKALEVVDLSQNHLNGGIPDLPSSVSKFNVSFNNLSGEIPTGGQFDKFSMPSYLPGNPGLCGDVIQRPCLKFQPRLPPNMVIHVPMQMDQFWISDIVSVEGFGIGVAVGFVSVLFITIAWSPSRHFVFGSVHSCQLKAGSKPC